jgi:hypothetical protein
MVVVREHVVDPQLAHQQKAGDVGERVTLIELNLSRGVLGALVLLAHRLEFLRAPEFAAREFNCQPGSRCGDWCRGAG